MPTTAVLHRASAFRQEVGAVLPAQCRRLRSYVADLEAGSEFEENFTRSEQIANKMVSQLQPLGCRKKRLDGC